jgi:hypothetical protein
MKVARNLVDGVLGGLAVFVIVGACAPKVTVSRGDDEEEAGGAGGTDATGGTGAMGGTAGSMEPTGGVGAANTGGIAGDASYGGTAGAGQGGTAGVPHVAGAGQGGTTSEPQCPCSRREGAPVSRNCPRGAGISSSTYVEMAGNDAVLSGTAATIGTPFRVRVFAGSIAYNTELILTELTVAAPEEFFDYSPVYRVEPDDLDFENGGEVTVPWQVADGQVPSDLDIYYSESEDGPYERMEDSYQNAGFSQATILRTGYFFVGAPKPEELEHCP